MKGFDIWLNERKFSIAVDRGVTVISIDREYITISGIDDITGSSVNWGRFETKMNDKIIINAATIDESDVPIEATHIDRQELLARYLSLKEILIKEGVLK